MRLARLVMVVPLCGTSMLAAQERAEDPVFSVAPALLHQNDDYTIAARFNALLGSRRHEVTRAFPRSRYWRAEARGTLAADADLNPDPLSLGVAGGVSWSLAKPRVIPFDPAEVDAPGSAMEFDYGDLSLGALADVETNQRRTEARFAFNLELVYTHDHQRGIWPFVPSIYAIVGAGRSLASASRDSQAISETESYLRLTGGAAWHLSADRTWMPAFARPIWLHATVDLYREDGDERATVPPGDPIGTGAFDGTRVTLGAAYRLLTAERGVVDEIFVRWTNGETPTLPAPRKAWMLGVRLAP